MSTISVALPFTTAIAEDPGSVARHLDVEPLLDDIDDLVDDEAHGTTVVGEYQDRLGALLLDGGLGVDPQQRHELVTVLQKVTTVGDFNLAAIDLLEARHQRKQNGFRLLRAGAEHKQGCQVLVGCPAVIELNFIGAARPG